MKTWIKYKTVLFTLLIITVEYASAQTTFTVTSTSKDGPGSFNQAILDANSNPGADIIEFTPGLQVHAAHPNYLGGSDGYMSVITESVTIDGKGGALNGYQKWVSQAGEVNSVSQCPGTTPTDIIIAVMPNFMEVSPGITVTVKNLSIKQFNSIAIIRNNATLNLENFSAKEIRSTYNCTVKALIRAEDGANLSIKDSRFSESYNFASDGSGPMISSLSNAGNLTIQNSLFYSLEEGNQYLIFWLGSSTSEVNIVSSRLLGSGGIFVGGSNIETNIVNSTMTTADTDRPRYGERVVNGSSGPMNIIGSSIKWNSNQCETNCPVSSQILIESLNGVINFSESALGFNFKENTGNLLATLGGSGSGFTADVNTWIESTFNQDASALQTITSQPSLITGTPGFKSAVATQIAYNDAELVSPDVSGVLIDVVNTPLINPVDGNPITEDVLGNERFDANGFRDIGALQLSLAPILTISNTGVTFVDILWQEPLHHNGDPIVRYEYQYVPISGGSPVIVDAGTNLSANVTGLTNGTTYEFSVRAVYNELGGEVNGPFGNVEVATPLTDQIPTPSITATPGDSEVSLSWNLTDLGGRTFSAYIVLWKEVGTANTIGGQSITDAGTTTTNITGLTNDTDYEFSVAVITTNNDRSDYGIDTATPTATLNVNELTKEVIAFYPNPVNDILQIKLQSTDINIQLYSVSGRLLKEIRNVKTIDLSNLSAGVYFLKMTSENKVYSGKLIKN